MLPCTRTDSGVPVSRPPRPPRWPPWPPLPPRRPPPTGRSRPSRQIPRRPSSSAGASSRPLVLPLIAAAVAWWRLLPAPRTGPIRTTPLPPLRRWSFVAGLLAIAVALQSGIERYDTTLFSVHMVQHMLLTLVAPPLPGRSGAPVTPGPPGRLAGDPRARWILPVLRSRLVGGSPTRSWRGSSSSRSCGGPTSRRSSTSRSSSPSSTTSSTSSTSGRPSCSGGRPWPWTRRRAGWVTPAGSSTSSCRCPRTRSWRWPSCSRTRRSTPTT